MHAVAPADAKKEVALHATHAVALVAAWYCPVAQSEQAVEAAADEYLPPVHATQVEESAAPVVAR